MLFIVKTLIKYLLIPIGAIYSALFSPKDEILILMYHRVDSSVKKELAVSPKNFKWHMKYLYDKGYSVITMDEAYAMISKNNIKGRHIVITFDDGYKDFYTNAYPILKSYNFPSIMYLCPGYVGTTMKYWWDRDEKEAPIMDWEDINKLNKEGLVEFGSHTIEHMDMDKLSPKEIKRELIVSRGILENKLGKSVKHFSYPRGIYSRAGQKILKQYYDTGVLISNGRRVDTGFSMDHVYTLKRIPVLRSDGRLLFVGRIKGWLVLEELIRKKLSKD